MKHAVVRLWNSYNFSIVASSKTYAPSAISDAKKPAEGCASQRRFLSMHRSISCWTS
jgi:hypothetical protein